MNFKCPSGICPKRAALGTSNSNPILAYGSAGGETPGGEAEGPSGVNGAVAVCSEVRRPLIPKHRSGVSSGLEPSFGRKTAHPEVVEDCLRTSESSESWFLTRGGDMNGSFPQLPATMRTRDDTGNQHTKV